MFCILNGQNIMVLVEIKFGAMPPGPLRGGKYRLKFINKV
jgi:hypothetical protein